MCGGRVSALYTFKSPPPKSGAGQHNAAEERKRAWRDQDDDEEPFDELYEPAVHEFLAVRARLRKHLGSCHAAIVIVRNWAGQTFAGFVARRGRG